MDIAIIGCGNMGSALAKGLKAAGGKVYLCNRNHRKAEDLAEQGYGIAANLQTAISHADIVIIAMKPQSLAQAASEITQHMKAGQLLISVLAGISIENMKKYFKEIPVVCMMPNLAVMHHQGIIGASGDPSLFEDFQLEKIFKPLGHFEQMSEEKLEALGALAGSGPAFVFNMVEAMIEAGIAMGFSAKDAQKLVRQMIHGSMALLENSNEHPGALKWQITSPGGTTIAGLKKMEEMAVHAGIMNTILAAYEKSRAFSKEK